MTGDLLRFPPLSSPLSSDQARVAAEKILSTPFEERTKSAASLYLEQSEILLALCQLLDERMQGSPFHVARDAEFVYQFVEDLPPSSGSFLFDEREYYLGEFALLAGCACRFLSRRDEARTWFDRAESWFLLTANSAGDIARLTYQRLAAKVEERQFSEVLRGVRALSEYFRRNGSTEFELKCRILRGLALQETNRLPEALDLFNGVCREAQEIGSALVSASAYVNLVQIHCELGHAEDALAKTREATPLLQRINNRVALAKLQWGIGMLLRKQGRTLESIEVFRVAQQEFAEIEMRADVAALNLVIADLLLELGQQHQAEWEIRAALPVIDELKMVPEGVAALSLLRESMRRRSIDRQALRDLHGYFDDSAR